MLLFLNLLLFSCKLCAQHQLSFLKEKAGHHLARCAGTQTWGEERPEPPLLAARL